MSDVYRDGKVHVSEEKCKTCVFRPGNLMNLEPGRVAGMCAEADAEDGAITCHSTLYRGHQAVCRGYFDRRTSALLQIAERLGIIVYVPAQSLSGD